MPDYDMEDLLKHRLEQENRFTKLEGRMTAVERCAEDIKVSVKDIYEKVNEVPKAVAKWSLGVIVTLGIFTLGLIVTLITVVAKLHGG